MPLSVRETIGIAARTSAVTIKRAEFYRAEIVFYAEREARPVDRGTSDDLLIERLNPPDIALNGCFVQIPA